MRHLVNMFIVLLLLAPLAQVRAQWFGGGGGGPQGDRPERLERFRKLRMVEYLRLGEEEAVRFFAKQSTHENNVRDLMKERNGLLDKLEDTTGAVRTAQEINKLSDSVLDLDKKMFAERERFQADVRKLLTPAQYAKFLVFERAFGRQVRDAFQEMHREGRNRPGDAGGRE